MYLVEPFFILKCIIIHKGKILRKEEINSIWKDVQLYLYILLTGICHFTKREISHLDVMSLSSMQVTPIQCKCFIIHLFFHLSKHHQEVQSSGSKRCLCKVLAKSDNGIGMYSLIVIDETPMSSLNQSTERQHPFVVSPASAYQFSHNGIYCTVTVPCSQAVMSSKCLLCPVFCS